MTAISWSINYFSFYIIWCLCIWGASQNRPMLPLFIVALYLIVHLLVISRSPFKEAVLILAVSALGCLNESILAYFNMVAYTGSSFLGVSWWTISLYMCFATTLWYSFAWLIHRPVLSCMLSAIAMPMCYLGMGHAGVISFPSGEITALIRVGVQYAVLIPFLGYTAIQLQQSKRGIS